jgi:hypothetical protein
MTPTQIRKMIKKWDTKNVKEWAEEFDIPTSAIMLYVKLIRENAPDRCKPKKPWDSVRRKRKMVIDEVMDEFARDPNHTFKDQC